MMKIHFCISCRSRLVITERYKWVWVMCPPCARESFLNYLQIGNEWFMDGVENPWFRYGHRLPEEGDHA
jgi:hypothetical protein